MKLVLAFALFTVALAADIAPVYLPSPRAPFVADEHQAVEIVHLEAVSQIQLPEAPLPEVANEEAYRVKFVDAPIENVLREAPIEVAPEDLMVKFVDAPLEVAQDAPVADAEEMFKVKFVEAPVANVDEAMVLTPVIVAVPEIPSTPLNPAILVTPVKVVDLEQPRYPGKVYDNPMLR